MARRVLAGLVVANGKVMVGACLRYLSRLAAIGCWFLLYIRAWIFLVSSRRDAGISDMFPQQARSWTLNVRRNICSPSFSSGFDLGDVDNLSHRIVSVHSGKHNRLHTWLIWSIGDVSMRSCKGLSIKALNSSVDSENGRLGQFPREQPTNNHSRSRMLSLSLGLENKTSF
jgi:hypothetical protein